MILNVTDLKRTVDTTDFSDITASQKIGPAVLTPDGLDIPFDVNPSPAEVDKIILRLTTSSSNEEVITNKAKSALASNSAWQTNSYPQLVTGADAIVNSSTANATEKNLARAVKTLSNQANDLTTQNNALIRLLLRQFDATS